MNVSGSSHPGSRAIGGPQPPAPPPRAANDDDPDTRKTRAVPGGASGTSPGAKGSEGLLDITT